MSDGRGTPFVINKVNIWIECEDDDGPKGLRIKVRRDITNRERDDLNEWYRTEVGDYQREWLNYDAEKRAQTDADQDTPRDREWTMLASYILDWNIEAENTDGEIVAVPAPADGGPDVFHLVTKDAIDWMMKVVLVGYRATGKANGLRDA